MAEGESVEVELKQSFHRVQEIARIIAAFANTQGDSVYSLFYQLMLLCSLKLDLSFKNGAFLNDKNWEVKNDVGVLA